MSISSPLPKLRNSGKVSVAFATTQISSRPSLSMSRASTPIELNARPSSLNATPDRSATSRSEEHTSELQSPCNLVCRLLLEKKKTIHRQHHADAEKNHCSRSDCLSSLSKST